MTKKLEELFELPTQEKEVNESQIEKAEADLITEEAYNTIDHVPAPYHLHRFVL